LSSTEPDGLRLPVPVWHGNLSPRVTRRSTRSKGAGASGSRPDTPLMRNEFNNPWDQTDSSRSKVSPALHDRLESSVFPLPRIFEYTQNLRILGKIDASDIGCSPHCYSTGRSPCRIFQRRKFFCSFFGACFRFRFRFLPCTKLWHAPLRSVNKKIANYY